MEHRFTGPAYTIGIEEELMIVDAETLELSNSIESLLEALGETNAVKPELMESVCEIATEPCRNTREAGRQLRDLRKRVQTTAEGLGLAIGSAGTHPFAMWEDQRIVARPRYRDLIAGLQFVARQELIFGVHVHVGVDDPDKAVYVANGMRVHVPLLLALSANSPFWRGDETRLLSTRTPIFRAFPRVGIPPRYDDWDDYQRRIEFMVESRTIEDYTYLWYDVRPHPNFGTVEIRVMDAQTRVEHTLGAGRAGPGDGQGAVREVRPGLRARALPVRDARREQVPRRPPRARGHARGPAGHEPRARRATSSGASSTGCGRTPRSSDPRTTSSASTTCSRRATAPRGRSSSSRRTTTCAR